jgi:hypothetical protein
MTGIAAQFAKGSTVDATLDFIRAEHGEAMLGSVLDQLTPDLRAAAEHSTATGEVAYEQLVQLWAAADAVVAPVDPGWMERAGAFSIGHRGAQMYGGILRKKDPTEFLTQSISLFRLYYHPGDIEVVEHASGRAVLRLIGFEARTPLFCRRQTGGLSKAIELAGGNRPGTRHVRCVLEGDAYCEWELTWGEAVKAQRDAPARTEQP